MKMSSRAIAALLISGWGGAASACEIIAEADLPTILKEADVTLIGALTGAETRSLSGQGGQATDATVVVLTFDVEYSFAGEEREAWTVALRSVEGGDMAPSDFTPMIGDLFLTALNRPFGPAEHPATLGDARLNAMIEIERLKAEFPAFAALHVRGDDGEALHELWRAPCTEPPLFAFEAAQKPAAE